MGDRDVELSEKFEWYGPHQDWLGAVPGGKRAVLWGENLAGADLRGANLRRVDFRGATLVGTDLRCADLRCANLGLANLRFADLRFADLRGANLFEVQTKGAVGFRLLTVTDHGYCVCVVDRGGWWRVVAGCRDFSFVEARMHWGSADYHTPSSGRRILACLDWFEEELVRDGS
jgi:hypothetical protein